MLCKTLKLLFSISFLTIVNNSQSYSCCDEQEQQPPAKKHKAHSAVVTPYNVLPNEVWQKIVFNLDHQSLKNCRLISHHFLALVQESQRNCDHPLTINVVGDRRFDEYLSSSLKDFQTIKPVHFEKDFGPHFIKRVGFIPHDCRYFEREEFMNERNMSYFTSMALFGSDVSDEPMSIVLDTFTRVLKTNMTITSLNFSNFVAVDSCFVSSPSENYSLIGQQMGRIIAVNTTLISLLLSGNSIDDHGIEALAQSLEDNSTLKTLDLTDNKFDRRGQKALGTALQHNNTLTSLNLSYNQIEEGGCQEIGKALQHNSSLTELNLSINSLGPIDAQALSQGMQENCTLKVLNLSSNKIRDGSLALGTALQHNHTLASLNLSYNQIEQGGCREIGKALQHNSSLTELDLCVNLLGPMDAQALGQGVQDNHTLKVLDLSSNKIKDGSLALAKTLQHNNTLTSLNISYNKIEDADKQTVLLICPKRLLQGGVDISN